MSEYNESTHTPTLDEQIAFVAFCVQAESALSPSLRAPVREWMTPHILVSLRGYAALQSQLQAERQFKADALEKQCRAESQNAELVELGDKLREQIGFGLVTALRAQRQIDNDGCEVGVSRQACDEAAEFLESFAALSKVQS